MQLDRDYYRCCSDRRLIEEAQHNPNAELAIALAERLGGKGRGFGYIGKEAT